MLLLSGCHLFATAPTIDCVVGDPCADSGADTDTGTTVTEPQPSVGWIIALDGGAKSKVRRYDASGEMAREWSGFTGALQVAWDEGAEVGVFLEPAGVYTLAADGTSEKVIESVEVSVGDVAFYNDMVLLSLANESGSGLYVWDQVAADGQAITTAAGTFSSIAVKGDKARVLYSDGQPDIYSVSPAFKATVSEGAFDQDDSLVGGLALGLDDALFLCSPTGAIYAVADLAAGVRTPAVVYDGAVSDVSSCAYDAEIDAWLLGSDTVGVIRLDATGRSENLYETPGGYTIFDISFY